MGKNTGGMTMSKSLVGTKTLENLMKAFAGECQARTRYTYYSSVARKAGYVQIANIFMETAENEKEHAKKFMKWALEYTKGENPRTVNIAAGYPLAYAENDTLANLKAAAQGEHEEWTELYSAFARVSEDEHFPDIAHTFREIAEVEERHETRYLKLAANIETGAVFVREQEVEWKCNNCGYIHRGKNAPDSCPACAHPRGYFELFVESY
jgi:rubrerythrin